jgi:hypothetical protein
MAFSFIPLFLRGKAPDQAVICVRDTTSPSPGTQRNFTTLARGILIASGLESGGNLAQTGRHERPGGSKDTAVIKEGDHIYRNQPIKADLAKTWERRVVMLGARKIKGNVIPLERACEIRGSTHGHLQASDVHP